MATNITTAASSFVTASMKPAANDQADALWAQNIGDDLGHLYYKAQLIPVVFWSSSSGVTVSGHFYKKASHNAIRAAFASNGAVGSLTATLRAFAGTKDWGNFVVGGDTPDATTSSAITVSADTQYTLELDISSLTNGSLYYAHLTFSTNLANAHPPGLFLIHSLSATY